VYLLAFVERVCLAERTILMSIANTATTGKCVLPGNIARYIRWLLLGAILLGGCSSNEKRHVSEELRQETFCPQQVSAERSAAILSDLGLRVVAVAVDPNTLSVNGSPDEVRKAGLVIDLVDSNDPYVVETLAPASEARTLPSNQLIAQALGNIAIGTFSAPPSPGRHRRAIIDIHNETIVAIVPVRVWPDIRAIVEFAPGAYRLEKNSGNADTQRDNIAVPASEPDCQEPPDAITRTRSMKPRLSDVISNSTDLQDEPEPPAQQDKNPSPRLKAAGRNSSAPKPSAAVEPQHEDRVLRGVLKPSVADSKPSETSQTSAEVAFLDGDDVLELTLPERINLAQLIDLVGEYLHLDCMYDADGIGNQVVTLKLHSKLRSEITVGDLYSLLETILKFRGLIMTRHEGNLVTIVPAADALDVDPDLVDPSDKTLQAGDMVVTRVFELQHVDVSSVTNLLQNMKLSVAVSTIAETQTLFVTCYAHRLGRIEKLVGMVDKPGKPKEFRFRRLQHTDAQPLAQKVLALASEFEDIPISIAPTTRPEPASRSSRRPKDAGGTSSSRVVGPDSVYLDTDERTNCILMIGHEEQLETVESLIEMLDVPQDDLPVLQIYEIVHVPAQGVLRKLSELEIGPITQGVTRGSKTTKTGAPTEPLGGDLKMVLLEATNSLLVNATPQQHDQIRTIIGYIDVLLQDPRTLRAYDIEYADADEVVTKLEALGFLGMTATSAPRSPKTVTPRARLAPAATVSTETALAEDPQVVILEATNSLLIYASDEQHSRLRAAIPYVDVEVRRERVPYEIYFLENQDPNHLSDVLGRLVEETFASKDDKIERLIQRTDDEIVIIPDAGTFSLIVRASRKNQEWIAGLIEQLDKRRPQVLIDITLVEINKTEAFTYDLNLVQSFPDLTTTSGLTGTISGSVTSSDLVNRLSSSGRSQFADYQSNSGNFTGFYGDKHINLLLSAMQSKNYGRVLAKPKILVNDNQPGTIKAADTTYVAKRSSIPVGTGGAGNDATLIETAVDYQSYEAGITLDITPHISQGELLRLDIELTRSDFRETEDDEKPPDTTASELTTTVFVPDGSTIILGGLVKLNQNKGGAKVPILGDIPIAGGLFRSISNKDIQNRLYVFVKAEIIRPSSVFAQGMVELDVISERSRAAFEKHEREFQDHEDWPGIKPESVDPAKVLEAQ
jgi:type II secretory pathway component GspD/PulD (secretin)